MRGESRSSFPLIHCCFGIDSSSLSESKPNQSENVLRLYSSEASIKFPAFICVCLCPSVGRILFSPCRSEFPPTLCVSVFALLQYLHASGPRKRCSCRKVALLDLSNSCIYPCEPQPNRRPVRLREDFAAAGFVLQRPGEMSARTGRFLVNTRIGNQTLWQDAALDTLGKR
jgi:hypothetical protein